MMLRQIVLLVGLLSVVGSADYNDPVVEFELPRLEKTNLPHLLKHTRDNRLVVNLELLQMFMQHSPEQLRQALDNGDQNGLLADLISILKGIIKEVSFPCITDLLVFVQRLFSLAQTNRKVNHCYATQLADSQELCDCVSKAKNPNNKTDAAAALPNPWPLKVLDSMGKPGSGVLDGNVLWVGSYPQCTSIDEKITNHRNWQGKYCRATIYMKSNPLAAFSDEKKHYPVNNDTPVIPTVCKYCENGLIIVLDKVNAAGSDAVQMCKPDVVCDEYRHKSFADDGWSIAVLCFLIVIAGIMSFGTAYDYFTYQPVLESIPPTDKVLRKEYYHSQTMFIKVLLAFSVITNTNKIFNTEKLDGQIHCVHGLRFLSMLWIMLSHTYYYAATSITMDNLLGTLTIYPKKFLNQIILNGSLAVDTFFFLAGLLCAYLWFKAAKQTKGRHIKKPAFWANFYVHRYLRLTPVYMIVLAVHVTLLEWVANGPFWHPVERERCAKSWWANLLYINNFVKLKDEDTCMGWTWYLANDMQFYLFVPIILVVLWWKEIVGYLLIASLTVMSCVLHLILILPHNWPPAPTVTSDSAKATYILDYWPEVYVKPYVRCGPYVIGVLTGYILYKCKLKLTIPKWQAALGWLLCIVSGLGTVFGLYEYCKTGQMSTAGYWIFALFGRVSWAYVLFWITLACATGYGGPVNAFLSWKAFAPLGRLTYCAYLIHPVIMITYYRSRQATLHFGTHVQMIGMFFGFAALSYLVAYAVSLAFEQPGQLLELIGHSFGRSKLIARENSTLASNNPSDLADDNDDSEEIEMDEHSKRE